MAVVFNLDYRVARVRFWTENNVFMTPLGCQFIFQHRISGEEVEGDAVNVSTPNVENVTVHEFELEDDEVIDAVHGCDNIFNWALEVETNTGRKFRAGGENLDGETRRAPRSCEVRGIVCPPGQQEFKNREPVYGSSIHSELYGVIFDPNYRVSVVRLWSAGAYFDGCQFVYRHRVSGHEVEGEAMVTERVKTGDVPRLEIELLEGEYLRGLEGREGAWTDAVEIVTSLNRKFRVGGSGGSIFVRTSWEMELRGIVCGASDVIRNVAPIYANPHPTDLANKRVQQFGSRTKGDPADDTDPATLIGDLTLNQAFRVARINVWSVDGMLCGLQLVYKRIGTEELVPDAAIVTGNYSRANAQLHSCELADDEVLTGLSTTLHSAVISTSAGRQVQLLGTSDSGVVAKAPVGTEIRGLDTPSLGDLSTIRPVLIQTASSTGGFSVADISYRVHKITFWASKTAVYGYEITYRNVRTGAVYTSDAVKAEHLGDDVSELAFELFPSEYIVGLSNYTGDGTNGVEISLSTERSLEAGCLDGVKIVAHFGDDIEVRGVMATVGATVSNFNPIRMQIPNAGDLTNVYNSLYALSGDITVLSTERDQLLTILGETREKLASYDERMDMQPVVGLFEFGALIQDVKEALATYVASEGEGEQALAASLETLTTRAQSLDQLVTQCIRDELETFMRMIATMRPGFDAEKALAILRTPEFVAPLGQTLKLAEDIEDAEGFRCLPDDLCGAFYSMKFLVQIQDLDKFKTPDLRPFLGGGDSSEFASMFAAYQNYGLMVNHIQQCVARANGEIPDDEPEASPDQMEELADVVRGIALASYATAVGEDNVKELLKGEDDCDHDEVSTPRP